MIVKLLTEHRFEFLSLKRGCTGSSESTHVKMPHCWKSHAMARMCLILFPVKYKCILYKAFWCFCCIFMVQSHYPIYFLVMIHYFWKCPYFFKGDRTLSSILKFLGRILFTIAHYINRMTWCFHALMTLLD